MITHNNGYFSSFIFICELNFFQCTRRNPHRYTSLLNYEVSHLKFLLIIVIILFLGQEFNPSYFPINILPSRNCPYSASSESILNSFTHTAEFDGEIDTTPVTNHNWEPLFNEEKELNIDKAEINVVLQKENEYIGTENHKKQIKNEELIFPKSEKVTVSDGEKNYSIDNSEENGKLVFGQANASKDNILWSHREISSKDKRLANDNVPCKCKLSTESGYISNQVLHLHENTFEDDKEPFLREFTVGKVSMEIVKDLSEDEEAVVFNVLSSSIEHIPSEILEPIFCDSSLNEEKSSVDISSTEHELPVNSTDDASGHVIFSSYTGLGSLHMDELQKDSYMEQEEYIDLAAVSSAEYIPKIEY